MRRDRTRALSCVGPSGFGLFAQWAASIRHEALGDRRSRIIYSYSFRARPAWLAFLLEPILGRAFRWETRRRLQGLRAALVRAG